MKRLLFSLLLLIFSCTDKKEKISSVSEPEPSQPSAKHETAVEQDSVFTAWLEYYRKGNPGFAENKFKLTSSSPISYNPSNVTVMDEKGFNEIYKPFFIFNESKSHYLDFDSYHWSVSKDGSAGFEADQQVALVDMKKKTAVQIAFFGPSYTVEDAFWKGDSTVVLLGNSYEKVPFMMKFNFPKNKVQHFQYSDTLKFDTPYSEIRLRRFGIKTE